MISGTYKLSLDALLQRYLLNSRYGHCCTKKKRAALFPILLSSAYIQHTVIDRPILLKY